MRGAPEHLHDALSGDIIQQGYLARCLDKDAPCAGYAADPPMACAWRGVRLASHSPTLSLSDSEAFVSACAAPDEVFRQRASIALMDLSDRVFGRKVGALDQMTATAESRDLLYPSIDAVRTRVNSALAQEDKGERLPPFAPAGPGDADQPVAWSSCGPTVCLEGFTPAFGGGLISFRVSVKSQTASPSQTDALAAKLAAAALEAPSAAAALSAAAPTQITAGPVCWSKGRGPSGLSYAGAARAPCHPVAAQSGA
ncbi:hypothetical protein ACO2Q3_20660 [Caulobacter sp. KR2-114]|uniref:hypothetical protein n=1 Tax=Caulobacter sp. KR2-114 TaxID=3400912 RepID=UPI003C11F113